MRTLRLGIIVGLGLCPACGDDTGTASGSASGSASDGSTASGTTENTSVPDGTTTVDSAEGTTTSPATSAATQMTTAETETDEEGSTSTGEPAPIEMVVVTFNTGTTTGLLHGIDGDDYGSDEADISDEHYGDGLAWQTNVDLTTQFFAELQPDVVVFQEIFYSGDCPSIPPEFHPGFVCETWQPGDPTVVELVMGPDYQIACHLGRSDKCAAVRKDFGTIVGCEQDFCLEGLDGSPINGCGGGSRIGRGLIELPDGQQFTLTSVHGTSGQLPDDWDCRERQVEQVFVDFDGEPAANGRRNLVMGDLNTDPYRAVIDPSADRWRDFVGDGEAFDFISEAGLTVTPTYQNLFNIDHVMSEHFVGDCEVPGVTPGVDPVLETVYFDHHPIVCTVTEPR